MRYEYAQPAVQAKPVERCLSAFVLCSAPRAAQSDDGLSDNKMAPVCTAVKYTLACVFVSGLILGLCYFFVSGACPESPLAAGALV